jgi:hypothetical protein
MDMQFRKQKTLIQVMKYVGYDKKTRQPEVKMLGTIDLKSMRFEPKPGINPLSDVEQLEIRQAIERAQLELAHERAAEAAQKAFGGLRGLREGTDLSQMVRNDPEAVWRGLVMVEKALKAGGFARPTRRAAGKDTKTGDLLKA